MLAEEMREEAAVVHLQAVVRGRASRCASPVSLERKRTVRFADGV